MMNKVMMSVVFLCFLFFIVLATVVFYKTKTVESYKSTPFKQQERNKLKKNLNDAKKMVAKLSKDIKYNKISRKGVIKKINKIRRRLTSTRSELVVKNTGPLRNIYIKRTEYILHLLRELHYKLLRAVEDKKVYPETEEDLMDIYKTLNKFQSGILNK